MTVTPELDPELAGEAALAHLLRSVVTGSLFDVYSALVVDLDGRVEPSEEAAATLAAAVDACLRRRRSLAAGDEG